MKKSNIEMMLQCFYSVRSLTLIYKLQTTNKKQHVSIIQTCKMHVAECRNITTHWTAKRYINNIP
jgi:hypothetical protein